MVLKKKRAGHSVLPIVMIMSIVMGFLSLVSAEYNSTNIKQLAARETSLYAQQLAESKYNELKLINYNDILTEAPMALTPIAGTNYSMQIEVGTETSISGVKYIPVTIKIFKNLNTQIVYTLTKTLNNVSSTSVNSQFARGGTSVSVTADADYKYINAFLGAKFGTYSRTHDATAVYTIYVNGRAVGSISSSSHARRAGGSGQHYHWQRTNSKSNIIKTLIAAGDTVSARLTSSDYLEAAETEIMLILNN